MTGPQSFFEKKGKTLYAIVIARKKRTLSNFDKTSTHENFNHGGSFQLSYWQCMYKYHKLYIYICFWPDPSPFLSQQKLVIMSDYLGPVRLDIVDCLMLEKLNIPGTQMLKNRFKQLVKLSLAAHFGLGTHLFEARQVLPLLTFRLKIKNKCDKMWAKIARKIN